MGDLHRKALNRWEFPEDGCSEIEMFPYFCILSDVDEIWIQEISIKN
jgi:hypothetical protein